MKRIVTYDIREEADYQKFYALKDKYNAEELAESTYEFNTNVDINEFIGELCEVFSPKDKAYLIYISKDKKLSTYKI